VPAEGAVTSRTAGRSSVQAVHVVRGTLGTDRAKGMRAVARPNARGESTAAAPEARTDGEKGMAAQNITVLLVHGAFAESASWNPVISRLRAESIAVVAVSNPLRSIFGDADYLRDVITGVGTPVVLVGHSYGGAVITEAAADKTRPELRRSPQ
jgi:pimeloyl-ACP methyl ester carboxylesterase